MEIDHLEAFYVVGLAVRTTNAAEMTQHGKIGAVWGQFLQEQTGGGELYAVYTDYESDHNGPYTFVLGRKVASVQEVPPGLRAVQISAGRYAVVSSERGPAAQIVPAAWQKIWSMPPEALGGVRAFQADFEFYEPGAANPADQQVRIYVGLVR